MRILGTGIDYSTGEVLIDSIDEETFGQTIEASLARHADQVRSTARMRARGAAVRGEVERERTVDLGDPRAAGWTFLVNRDDPRRADIEKALGPLAEHRGMSQPSPLVFNGEPEEEWQDWMQEHYLQLELDGKKVPHYILIAGGPRPRSISFSDTAGQRARPSGALTSTPSKISRHTSKRCCDMSAQPIPPPRVKRCSSRRMAVRVMRPISAVDSWRIRWQSTSRRRDDFRPVP